MNKPNLTQVSPNICLTPEEHQGNIDYDEMRDNELQDKLDNETPNNNPVY